MLWSCFLVFIFISILDENYACQRCDMAMTPTSNKTMKKSVGIQLIGDPKAVKAVSSGTDDYSGKDGGNRSEEPPEVTLPSADDAGDLIPHLSWPLEVLGGCGASIVKPGIVDIFLKEIYGKKALNLFDSSNFMNFSLNDFLF